MNEQAVADEKRHNEWGHCSNPFCLRAWIEKAKEYLPEDVPMPSLQHVRLQFKPSYSRHEVSKYFYRRFNVVKKTQRKALQCHNPDMHYANSNSKKFRTVIVNEFSPDDTLIASVDDECHVKFGDPKNPLALAQKAKPQWVSEDVEVKAADHDTVIKSTIAPSVMLHIDHPCYNNLGSFYKGQVYVGLKDNSLHKGSSIRHVIEFGKTMTDQLENKLALILFSDGGGDRNHRFERVQVGLLHLAVMFNLEKTFAVKTAAGGSCWNMVERCMSALDVALLLVP